VKINSKALASGLVDRGYELVSGGTDNHIVLMDLYKQGISGSKLEKVCDEIKITLNRNMVTRPGGEGMDKQSALAPQGVRMGTPAITTRGYNVQDID
jgi:glycine hydroxymethyltransferase